MPKRGQPDRVENGDEVEPPSGVRKGLGWLRRPPADPTRSMVFVECLQRPYDTRAHSVAGLSVSVANERSRWARLRALSEETDGPSSYPVIFASGAAASDPLLLRLRIEGRQPLLIPVVPSRLPETLVEVEDALGLSTTIDKSQVLVAVAPDGSTPGVDDIRGRFVDHIAPYADVAGQSFGDLTLLVHNTALDGEQTLDVVYWLSSLAPGANRNWMAEFDEPTSQDVIDSIIEQIRSVSDPLGRIAVIDQLSKQLPSVVAEEGFAAADDFRAQRGTWAEIGRTLGITRQSAQQRFDPDARQAQVEKLRRRRDEG